MEEAEGRLEAKCKPGQGKWFSRGGLGVAFLVIVCVYAAFSIWIGFLVPQGWKAAILLLLAVPAVALVVGMAYLVPIAVHELGHVIAGFLVGFRLHSVAAGPLGLRRTPRGLRLYRTQGLRNGGAAMCHVQGDHRLRMRLLVFSLGGPIASITFVALSWWAYVWSRGVLVGSPNPKPWVATVVHFQSLFFVVMGGAVLFSCLVPLGKSVTTDGMQILKLMIGGPGAKRELAMAMLGALSSNGVRYRDWDQALVNAALEPKDESATHSRALYLAYLKAMDSGNVKEALDWITKAVAVGASSDPIHAEISIRLQFEYAFACARKGDPDEASRALAAIGPTRPVFNDSRLRAEAAIEFARGEYRKGKDIWAKFAESTLVTRSNSAVPENTVEFEWLGMMAGECTKRSEAKEGR